MSILIVSLTLLAIAMELPYILKPNMPKEKYDILYVVGDSVSAGIGGKNEKTWPKLLRDQYGIGIVNLAESGATVGSAVNQAAEINDENSAVLLEIGGNDFFTPTPLRQFKRDLERLSNTVVKNDRMVVMLELPLLPWHIKYGKAQRQCAKQFGVILIPKRYFVNVLSKKGASTDLAHLSPEGHQLMAKEIWSLLGENLEQ